MTLAALDQIDGFDAVSRLTESSNVLFEVDLRVDAGRSIHACCEGVKLICGRLDPNPMCAAEAFAAGLSQRLEKMGLGPGRP